MEIDAVLEAIGPLARARAGTFEAPVSAAATLRLWDHFGRLDELEAQPFALELGAPVAELVASYRRARERIAGTPYPALSALIDEAPAAPPALILAALGDWRLDDVRRWSEREPSFPLAAAARAGGAAALDLLRSWSREAQARPDMPRRPPAWTRGNEAWLVLVEHARLEPLPLALDLLTFWTAGPSARWARGRWAALPPEPRARLDQALARAFAAKPMGALHQLLVCDYGPTRADRLVPWLVARARPRDADFQTPGSVTGALARLDAEDPAALAGALSALPGGPRLCAAAVARPSLGAALAASFASPEAAAVVAFLRAPFPPPSTTLAPVADRALRDALADVAQGLPGEPVRHGLMPSRLTKLARLLLASSGSYPASELLRAARAAYTRARYAAHDAVAAMLVGPLTEEERRSCVEEVARLAHRRGLRLREKWHALLRWKDLRCPGCR